MFQLTAARRRLEVRMLCCGRLIWFQLTAARRRLAALATATMQESMVSTHSRPKAAGANLPPKVKEILVSTHSRPKAAGKLSSHSGQYSIGFNSQPPEGGWLQLRACHTPRVMFQLTAARRRLVNSPFRQTNIDVFQLTAARRRLVNMDKGFIR